MATLEKNSKGKINYVLREKISFYYVLKQTFKRLVILVQCKIL